MHAAGTKASVRGVVAAALIPIAVGWVVPATANHEGPEDCIALGDRQEWSDAERFVWEWTCAGQVADLGDVQPVSSRFWGGYDIAVEIAESHYTNLYPGARCGWTNSRVISSDFLERSCSRNHSRKL